MSTMSSFKSIENRHDICRGKDCMKKFCESLREHEMEIINFKKKKVQLLTKEQQESYENAKLCYICKEKIKNKYVKDKVRDVYVIQNIMCLKNFHFIIKELAEEFEKQLTCLGENIEKYITIMVPIEKEVTTIDKNEEDVKYILKK